MQSILGVKTIARRRGDGVPQFSNNDTVIVSKDGLAIWLCIVVEGCMQTTGCPEPHNRGSGW
jgi:hypothetical protein